MQKENAPPNDDPLLVLKYDGLKVLWRTFIPYGIGLLIFGFLAFYVAPGKQGIVARFFHGVAIFAVIGIIYLLLDMILTNKYSLYDDRIAKTYRFIGSIEMSLDGSVISFTTYMWGTNIIVTHTAEKLKTITISQRIRLLLMGFDCNLALNGSAKLFQKTCESMGIVFVEKSGGLEGQYKKETNGERDE